MRSPQKEGIVRLGVDKVIFHHLMTDVKKSFLNFFLDGVCVPTVVCTSDEDCPKVGDVMSGLFVCLKGREAFTVMDY